MYENIIVTPKENSQVEITGQIPTEKIAPFRKKALDRLNKEARIPGFRPGHIPENVLLEKFSEQAILEDAAEFALQEVVPELIEKHAPRYIARPKITIAKLAPGNPLGFSFTIAVRPEISLPNYRKIADGEIVAAEKGKETVTVSAKEVDEVVEQVRNNYAHQEFHKHESAETHEESGHDHAPADMEKYKPAITDDFVKMLGSFENVADFHQKITENLKKEKEQRLLERRRSKILERLTAETKFPIPQPLIEYELNKMVGQFEEDIRRLGISVDNYLVHVKKTREDLQKEWLPEAEKRARINLILEEIALKEKISADPTTVEQEVRRLKERHADLDPIQTESYVSHILTLEKTIAFLETPVLKE